MNILFFATSGFKPDPGGIAELGHQLATALKQEGHQVTVLTRGEGPDEFDGTASYEIIRTPEREPKELVEKLNSERSFDLFFMLVIDSSWRTARRVSKHNNIPLVLYVHGLEIRKKNNIYPIFLAKMFIKSLRLRNSDVVMCNSFATMLLAFRRRAVPEHTRVLWPGINTDKIPPEAVQATAAEIKDPYPGKTVFLTIGRVIARKGVDTVIRALPQVVAEYRDVVYVVAGPLDDGYKRQLESLSRMLGVEQHIHFTGYLDELHKEFWYRRQDVFIMDSRELANGDVEGFGIVFLEAGLYGKPVIGGDSGGVSDAIAHQKSGLLVDPESPDAASAAMIRLMEEPELRLEMGDNGRQRAIEQFSWQRQARRFPTLVSPSEKTLAQRVGRGDGGAYFDELKDLPKTEPIDKTVARENLLILKDVFDTLTIPFFLFFGTLLGALREKDFIAHDTDTDIVLFESYREYFIEAIPKLEEQGLRLVKTAKDDRVLSLYRNEAYIDIYFARRIRKGLQWSWYIDYSSVKEKFLHSFKHHSFLGIDVLIPLKSEAVLRQLYGRDWNTTKPGYEANHDYLMKLKRFIGRKDKNTSVKKFIKWIRERKG